MRKRSRISEALRENYNVVGLAGAAALSAALLNPIPLLVGLVAEAAYLLFVPDSKWYTARLGVRYDAEVARRIQDLRQQVFLRISPDRQARFDQLMHVRGLINDNKNSAERWFREVARKLDYLLEKWLQFADKEAEFRTHILSVYNEAPAKMARRGDIDLQMTEEILIRFEGEISKLQKRRESEGDHNTAAVLDKRIEVLEQRSRQIERIRDALTNLTQQMQLLEDSFALINDQLRARPPEQILADVEGIVYQTDSMTRFLEDFSLISA